MFENIVGQAPVVSLLEQALLKDQMPPALLFHGPKYSGKLTLALELARAITCKEDARWACLCNHCQAQRELVYPYTIMLGNRYFSHEIKGSLQAFTHSPNRATYYLFIRALRKLLRRFDSFLWEEDDQRFRKAKTLVARMNEALIEFSGSDFEALAQKSKEIKAMLEITDTLCAILSGYNISIGQIRALRHWATTTSWEKKVVIIEEADRMQESARNALLKILEEPPEGLYFILIAPVRTTIIPTLLSRLRPYQFLQRSQDLETEILERIFRLDQTNMSLKKFLDGQQGSEITHLADQFYLSMQNSGKFSDAYTGKLIDENFEEFLTALSEKIRSNWQQGYVELSMAQEQLRSLNMMKHQFAGYRQSPQMLMENFFFTYFNGKN